MEKLNSNLEKKIAVFISGRGSNLNSLIKHSKLKKSKYKIKLVISNKAHAKGLNYARRNKIRNYIIEKKLISFEKDTLKLISKFKIDIICLAGFMRILTPNFIK